MVDQEAVRLECLRLAVQLKPTNRGEVTADAVREAADKFAAWVFARSPATVQHKLDEMHGKTQGLPVTMTRAELASMGITVAAG